jgi:hypothetical protein
VRRPPRFVGTSGPNLSVEDYYQSSVPVVVGDTTKYGDQFHVDTAFTTKDLRLSLGAFSENVIKPSVAAVANRVDYIGLQMAKNSTANIVGVAGTPPTSLLTYLTAGAYLDAEAAPRDGSRAVVIEPFTGRDRGQPQGPLHARCGDQPAVPQGPDGPRLRRHELEDGPERERADLRRLVGFFALDADGDTTSATSASRRAGRKPRRWSLTFGATVTLKKGDVIQIANVFPVNPQNRQVYGTKRAVLRRAVGPHGTGFDRQPDGRSGDHHRWPVPEREHHEHVGDRHGDAVLDRRSRHRARLSPRNILFHKNAFTCAMVDLELPAGVVFAGRASPRRRESASGSFGSTRSTTTRSRRVSMFCSAGRRSTKSSPARSRPKGAVALLPSTAARPSFNPPALRRR